MMQITQYLADKAAEAAKEYTGNPVPLDGIGGHYLAGEDYQPKENETRMVILEIQGTKYLVFIRS